MPDLPLYQIVEYDQHFENAKSRTRQLCGFVCVPNKHGGAGLANVMGQPDGPAIYGIWMWILQLCSRQRPPREGWLTDNGKKNGRRLSARELSILFRCDVYKVQRALQVVCSPEVGFMRMAEGEPEGIAPRIPHSPSTDTAVPVEGYHGIPNEVTERKKERKNLSLSGELNDGDTDTGEAPQYPSTDTAVAVEGDQTGTVVSASDNSDPSTTASPARTNSQLPTIDRTEGQAILLALCRDRFADELPRGSLLPNDWDHWIDAAFPMNRESLDLIDWFYRVPDDHPIFNETKRRQSMSALVENLKKEPSKIRSSRKKIGLNGLTNDSGNVTEPNDGWTAARKEAAYELFAETKKFPPRFADLGASACRQVEEKIAGGIA